MDEVRHTALSVFLFTGPRRNIFEVEPTLHPDICGLDETVFHRAHTLHTHPRS